MKYCPACMQENADNAAVCSSCGYAFDSTVNSAGTRVVDSRPQSQFDSGDIIAGRYQVERVLGQGGMGMVYLARDRELRNREIALKMIHPHLIAQAEARQRFEDEVIICQELLHTGIVRVHDLKRWDDLRFFTMEYIDGHSLRHWINQRKGNTPPFTFPEVMAVINPLLDALAYAHRFTVHRDIKPENIMILGSFPDVIIKVLDFGIARTMSASRLTQTSHAMGTAYYMAPEQMAAAAVDLRADLYSVGMVLYEMITGEMAVGRFPLPGEIVTDLPDGIDRLIEKVLAPAPDRRHADAKSLLIEIQKIDEGWNSQLAKKLLAKRKGQDNQSLTDRINIMLLICDVALKDRRWGKAFLLSEILLNIDPKNQKAQFIKNDSRKNKKKLKDYHKQYTELKLSKNFDLSLEILEIMEPFIRSNRFIISEKSKINLMKIKESQLWPFKFPDQTESNKKNDSKLKSTIKRLGPLIASIIVLIVIVYFQNRT